MKTARLLLACVSASLLAACGSDAITAPATSARAAHPHYDSQLGTGYGSTSGSGSGTTDTCTVTYVTNPDGSITAVCQSATSSQLGTGY